MRSTFMGLEASKRGLFTQQSALYTTGHNIANANTLGYTRQRVNMQPTTGYPGIGLNTPQMPGFIGTGVEAGSVQRVRDAFIDKQFRQESNKLGYWESRSKAIEQMEDVLNEPSEFGLQKSFSLFWQSLQDLSKDPENGGARAVTVDRGVALAESFNYMHNSLEDIQKNLHKEINVSTSEINSILDQLAGLNKQIKEIEPNGYMPNDLYDARDVLLDELSQYFPIEVSYAPSGGKALKIAEGAVTVTMNGNPLVSGVDRVHVSSNYAPANDETAPFKSLELTDLTAITAGEPTGISSATLPFSDLPVTGKLRGLIDSYGYKDGNDTKGLYPEHMQKLDKLAEEFATAFNAQHELGVAKNQLVSVGPPTFFEGPPITAKTIRVVQAIIDDPNLVRAASANAQDGEEGNGANAKELAGLQSKVNNKLGGSSVQTYFEGMIGELGVKGQQAQRNAFNAATLMESVAFRRASVASVSLDEEMTDMIRFQQAYNASARMMTAVDETLDKIINGMGRVGL